MNQTHRQIAALALALALLAGGTNSYAQVTFLWTNTAAVGTYNVSGNWATNFVSSLNTNTMVVTTCLNAPLNGEVPTNTIACPLGGNGVPADFDTALFTNPATYTVKLSGNITVSSNMFKNPAFTEATVTFDVGTSIFSPIARFSVGDQANSTTTVYLASNNSPGFDVAGPTIVGGNGNGTLILTNGSFGSSASFNLGTGSGGRGKVVVSGNSTLTVQSQVSVGNNTNNSGGSSLIVSNGGKVVVTSSFRVGSGSGGGSSNNVLEVFSGGLVIADSGPVTIGRRSTSTGDVASVGNMVIVHSNGLFQLGIAQQHTMVIGNAGGRFAMSSSPGNELGIATNNLLRIERFGRVTNVSTIAITPTNSLELLGGYLGATTITNSGGTFTGWGSFRGNLFVTNGGTVSIQNSQGPMVVSNGLDVAGDSSITIELGTIFNPTVVSLLNHSNGIVVATTNNLRLAGTWNFVDSGGFAATTYTLFTYDTSNNGTNVFVTLPAMIGTTPNPSFTYTIDTNTLGQINLVVTSPGGGDPFITWQNFYFGSTVLSDAQPGADPDGDGMSNTNEFLAGFNPTNSAAYLHIISIAKTGNDMKVTYLGANGDSNGSPGPKTNVLEFTTGTANGSYTNNNWLSVGAGATNVLTSGTGLGAITNSVDVGGATATPSRYYRVRVLVP